MNKDEVRIRLIFMPLKNQNRHYRKALWMTLSPPGLGSNRRRIQKEALHGEVEQFLFGLSKFTRSHIRTHRYFEMHSLRHGEQKWNPHEHIVAEILESEADRFWHRLPDFMSSEWWTHPPVSLDIQQYEYALQLENTLYCLKHEIVVGRQNLFCPCVYQGCKKARRENSICPLASDFEIERH